MHEPVDVWSGFVSLSKFVHDQFMVFEHDRVDAAERNAPRETLRRDQPVKWIAGPTEFESFLNERRQGSVIKLRSRIGHNLLSETWGVDFTSAGLS